VVSTEAHSEAAPIFSNIAGQRILLQCHDLWATCYQQQEMYHEGVVGFRGIRYPEDATNIEFSEIIKLSKPKFKTNC
jgi:hypothetical protein